MSGLSDLINFSLESTATINGWISISNDKNQKVNQRVISDNTIKRSRLIA
jgi:hypothetical protein